MIVFLYHSSTRPTDSALIVLISTAAGPLLLAACINVCGNYVSKFLVKTERVVLF